MFSMTRERQLPQSKRGPRSKRNKTAKGGPENACSGRLVTVLVIEARDLIQADARKGWSVMPCWSSRYKCPCPFC